MKNYITKPSAKMSTLQLSAYGGSMTNIKLSTYQYEVNVKDSKNSVDE